MDDKPIGRGVIEPHGQTSVGRAMAGARRQYLAGGADLAIKGAGQALQ